MKRLVIANRGEIARRILRSARDRGFETAVISTPADRDALVRLEADDVLEVPSFLDAEAIVAKARKWKAALLHPGYGFLSESPAFAARVEEAGIVFVGPGAESMEALGNKERAKKLAESCGVPVIPSLASEEARGLSGKPLGEALAAKGIKAPFLVKAAGGGGGRGMRIVETLDGLPQAMRRASEEAAAGFGDPTVFVERFLSQPRHVEIQVFGDGQGAGVFLGERECSIQRRYQKVVEEAPSPVVDASLRERMGKAAVSLVERSRYRGAGTVEFLVDRRGRFFFLEVNTRLQVEHPVTEAVFDLDLVSAQLELAEGSWPKALPAPGSDVVLHPRRWAIEARVLAEDPRNDFLPTPGPLLRYREPAGLGIRVDSGVSEGGRVHAEFDSMIAKVIACGDTRADACERLSFALESMVVHGATTNLPFLQAVVRHPDFRSGHFSTGWIASHLDELTGSLLPEPLERRVRTRGFREQLGFAVRGGKIEPQGELAARFRSLGNQVARVGSVHEELPVELRHDPVSGTIWLSGEGLVDALRRETGTSFRHSKALQHAIDQSLREPERVRLEGVATALDAREMALSLFGETLRLEDPRAAKDLRLAGATDGEVRAPMAGKVLEVHVSEGDRVEEGDVLIVVESMKMQLEVKAPAAGRLDTLLVEPGQFLDGPEVLARIGPAEGSTKSSESG